MQNNANDPNPSHSTPTKRTFSSFFDRATWAFLLTTVLLAGYIWLHIPFSYLDADGWARTSISPWYDILATWLIAVIAAFVIGRVSAPRWPRLMLLLISTLILLTFILSCTELSYLRSNPEWVGVVKELSWIEPFERGIPSDLSDTIVPENFTRQGVTLSFLTAATTFRELNWYWIVVPIVDPEFTSFPGWLPVIGLNVIFSVALTLVGGATAVITTALQDLFRLLYGLFQTFYNRISRPSQRYTPPYRAYRWSSAQKRLAWGTVIVVTFTSLTLFTSATRANIQLPHLTWETESIYISSHPHVYALLPLDHDTLLAGTDEGVFRLDDGGKNWPATLAGLPNESVKELKVDPTDGTLFAGTSNGMFRSDDGVYSWQTASNGLTDTDIQALVLDFGTLFVGTKKGGVFRSDDGGRSWEATSESLTNTNVQTLGLDLILGTLFVGTDKGGVFRSDDGGHSWQAASEGLTDMDVQTLLLDQAAGTLFAGTDGGGVFRSDDGGRSWETSSEGLTNTSVSEIAIDPTDRMLFAGTSDGVFRSANGGRNWQATSTGLTNIVVQALALDRRDGTLFAGTDGGIFHSDDGGHGWQTASAGLTGTAVRALALEPQEGMLFAGTVGGGVFRSDDGGRSWQAASAGLTNTVVWALALESQEGTLFAGTWGGGVLRSDDGGRSWQAASAGLTGMYVWTLAFKPQERTLFAGTSEGVFRSDDGARSWQAASAGLTNTVVRALALESQEGTLFAGTAEGIFRSDDGGRSWQAASAGLTNTQVGALTLKPQKGTLFAGTVGGVFRSDDGGRSWQAVSAGLTDTYVWVLALALQECTLFAGTDGGGVFRSDNGGRSWQAASASLTNTHVRALALEPQECTLFAGTDGGGVFRSDNGGRSWQAANASLTNTQVRALALAPQEGTLFAGTDEGVFRSDDGGRSWQVASAGLTNTNVRALALEPQEGMLFAGTDEGVFRSNDGGRSWEAANEGLTDMKVLELAVDPQDSTLFADTEGGVFHSADGGTTWARANSLPDLSLVIGQGENLIWSYSDLDSSVAVSSHPTGNPVPIAQTVGLRSITARPISEGEIELIAVWGATLGRARLDITPYTNSSSWWLAIRGWTYRITLFLIANQTNILLGFGGVLLFIILLAYAIAYTTWASAYNVSILTFIRVSPWQSSKLAELALPALEKAWPTWHDRIRNSVLWWGDVIPADLRSIPRPYRRWALEKYLKENKTTQSIELRDDELRLLADERPRMWLDAWAITAGELHEARGLSKSAGDAVDKMAQAFGKALGLRLGESHDWAAGRAYSVSAPTLRLNVPPSFPLIFLAEPRPSDETVKMLSDWVDALRETGYFALVVPLEPIAPTVDIPAELQKWLRSSPRVDDFILLQLDDVLDMLSARDPMTVLVKQIVAQVDLKTISPFQDSGPCPPNMFFGREGEIKQIVEGVGRGDFAVVGNRKAGKTSLLQRVWEQLSSDSRFTPLLINCQNVRDTAGFCREFANISGLTLSDNTSEGFEQVVKTLPRANGLPVLLLDEVDALLNHDAQAEEKLSGTWRKLAQEGVCHFVFVGTATLARRLRDPNSVFFNFPQRMPLKYLPQEVAELVITEPMGMLGLILQPQDEVLKEIVEWSSGHPNLLQTLGKRLVEQANDKQERVITLEACEVIARSSEFADFYLDLIWGLVQPLEKLVTLVAPDESFEVTDVERRLEHYEVSFEPEALDEALEMLQVYAILKRHNRQYTFNPGHFREIVHRTQDVERLIGIQKRKLARQQA